METIVYKKGGNIYSGVFNLTKTQLNKLKKQAQKEGAVGYLIGLTYYNNAQYRVIVFFSEVPQDIYQEELFRRKNGFVGARWYWLE